MKCDFSCFMYNFETNKLSQIAYMNKSRCYAACTVFEGKIVVTGGESNYFTLKSAEAYDYYENKWTYLPDMVEKRSRHNSVSMGNKLFIIGRWSTTICEVFDSFSRKFTLLEPKYDFNLRSANKVASVGTLIFIISENNNNTMLSLYDVKKSCWSKINCSVLENLTGLLCVKYCIE